MQTLSPLPRTLLHPLSSYLASYSRRPRTTPPPAANPAPRTRPPRVAITARAPFIARTIIPVVPSSSFASPLVVFAGAYTTALSNAGVVDDVVIVGDVVVVVVIVVVVAALSCVVVVVIIVNE